VLKTVIFSIAKISLEKFSCSIRYKGDLLVSKLMVTNKLFKVKCVICFIYVYFYICMKNMQFVQDKEGHYADLGNG